MYGSASDIDVYFDENRLVLTIIGGLLFVIFVLMVFMHYYSINRIDALQEVINQISRQGEN